MRYIYQLGNGYMLGIENSCFVKTYTGYPYPTLEAPMDELLYDLYCMYIKDVSYDFFLTRKKKDFLDIFKSNLEPSVPKSIDELFLSDRETKFSLLYCDYSCYIYTGQYTDKVGKINGVHNLCNIYDDTILLVVPKWLKSNITFNLSDKESNLRLSSLAIMKLSLANSIYAIPLRDNKLKSDAVDTIIEDTLNKLSNKIGIYVPRSNSSDVDDLINHFKLYNYFLDNCDDSFLNLIREFVINKYRDAFKNSLIDLFSGDVMKLARRFSVKTHKKEIIGVFNILSSKSLSARSRDYSMSDDFFSIDLIEYSWIRDNFIRYKNGRLYINLSNILKERTSLFVKLMLGLNKVFYKRSFKNKSKLLADFGISTKEAAKHLIVKGEDSVLSKEYRFTFDSDEYQEFNLFAYKESRFDEALAMVYIDFNCVEFKTKLAYDFYEEFKLKLNFGSFREFMSDNLDYLQYITDLCIMAKGLNPYDFYLGKILSFSNTITRVELKN